MNVQNRPPDLRVSALVVLIGIGSAWALLLSPLADPTTPKDIAFWAASLVVALLAVSGIRRLAAIDGPRIYASVSALLFGGWLLYFLATVHHRFRRAARAAARAQPDSSCVWRTYGHAANRLCANRGSRRSPGLGAGLGPGLLRGHCY